jgi:2-polyprenyl-3-methyl-5-hydroxy-6-metoxy-1,4-benzoquinol methylase
MTSCPLCGGGKADLALADSSFYRCRSCGTVFNAAHRILSYSDSYFTDDYQAQYGKTYEQDFPAIYKAAQKRVSRILSLWNESHSRKPSSALDVGCAMGFFLKAASDAGIRNVKGLEISKFASGRGKKLFGFEYIRKPFEKAVFDEKFDVVTAWYFIEHSYESRAAFEKAASLVKKGGVMAFSVPSVFGPSYLLHRKEWAKTHPVDHRIDLSPGTVKKLMKSMGFSKCAVYPAGIHPNRVISEKNLLFPVFKPLFRTFSEFTAFSDTLEVYALKD